MTPLVICFVMLAFLIVVCIFGTVGQKADKINRRMVSVTGQQKKEIFEELELSFYKRFIEPNIHSLIKAMGRIFPQQKQRTRNPQLEKMLRFAGFQMSPSDFLSIKTIVVLVIIILTLIISFSLFEDIMIQILILLFGVALALLIPNKFLTARIKGRKQHIQMQLPEVIDILTVSIEAGLGLDSAILKISEKMSGPLIDEFKSLHREIQMGRPRREAFHRLSECADIPELQTFCSAINQAEQLGIPIKNILKVQATQMRVTRRQRAQERGMKAPVKILLPMIIFIFPVIFIILLGPTIIQLLQQFG